MTASRAAHQRRPAAGRLTRLRTPVALGVGALALAGATLLHDPNQPGSWLVCPFLATTGFYCPGCGTLRALHALMSGDPVTAWSFNPLLIASLPVFGFVWVATVRRAWLDVPRHWTPGPRLLALLPVLITAYWVLRNVPGFEFLGPPR